MFYKADTPCELIWASLMLGFPYRRGFFEHIETTFERALEFPAVAAPFGVMLLNYRSDERFWSVVLCCAVLTRKSASLRLCGHAQ
jgi:hypothetical protein